MTVGHSLGPRAKLAGPTAGPVPPASVLAGAFGSDAAGWPTSGPRQPLSECSFVSPFSPFVSPFRMFPRTQCQAVHVGGLGKAAVCGARSRNHAEPSRRSAGVRSRAAMWRIRAETYGRVDNLTFALATGGSSAKAPCLREGRLPEAFRCGRLRPSRWAGRTRSCRLGLARRGHR